MILPLLYVHSLPRTISKGLPANLVALLDIGRGFREMYTFRIRYTDGRGKYRRRIYLFSTGAHMRFATVVEVNFDVSLEGIYAMIKRQYAKLALFLCDV